MTEKDDLDERVPLTVEQAMQMLDVKEGRVHALINPGVNTLVGTDWRVETARACFEENGVELAGPSATSMGHGVVSFDAGRAVFFATRDGAAAEVAS